MLADTVLTGDEIFCNFIIMCMQTGACEERMVSTFSSKYHLIKIKSVKFIAQMHWVVCAEYFSACITVFAYADNKLTEIERFPVDHQSLSSLVVHPTRPCLLSNSSESESSLIKLWGWDNGWSCIQKFKCSGTPRYVREITFDPKDAYSFASVSNDGEINVCHSLYFP